MTINVARRGSMAAAIALVLGCSTATTGYSSTTTSADTCEWATCGYVKDGNVVECCGGAVCLGGYCHQDEGEQDPACVADGQSCGSDVDCCSATCSDGTCWPLDVSTQGATQGVTQGATQGATQASQSAQGSQSSQSSQTSQAAETGYARRGRKNTWVRLYEWIGGRR